MFKKIKKSRENAKVVIPAHRIIITLEEDLSPIGELSSAFTIRKWVIQKESVDCGKENKRKKRLMVRKMTERTVQ